MEHSGNDTFINVNNKTYRLFGCSDNQLTGQQCDASNWRKGQQWDATADRIGWARECAPQNSITHQPLYRNTGWPCLSTASRRRLTFIHHSFPTLHSLPGQPSTLDFLLNFVLQVQFPWIWSCPRLLPSRFTAVSVEEMIVTQTSVPSRFTFLHRPILNLNYSWFVIIEDCIS